ncbi:glycosyltransferase [Allorhizobium undicola]|uniref:glycosyltransferase n=1 Tax=Allorhizobium undicola TaxID=78527 RepID=UPI000560FD3C|nr:glycosyltransferase [Allorhizobium undicola]
MQLSIVMPSRRCLEASRFAIETALTFAEKSDAIVIVSDNSGDPAKKQWLDGLGPRLLRLESQARTGIDNLVHGLDAVATPYLFPMGDDDALFAMDGEMSVALEDLSVDVVALRPQTIHWADFGGALKRICPSFMAETAGERLSDYGQKTGGTNALYYSCYRTAVFREIIRHFHRHHPTRGLYADWAFVIAVLTCGKIVHNPAWLYMYDVAQWSTDEAVEGSNVSILSQIGLEAVPPEVISLLLFADIYCFTRWSGLPAKQEARRQVLDRTCLGYLKGFAAPVQGEPDRFPHEIVEYVAALARIPTIEQAFEAVLPVFEAMKPGLGESYRRFSEIDPVR